ncbi:MAG TPA: hypothetical protein VIF15_12260 [Polyangiaceae bacterium]
MSAAALPSACASGGSGDSAAPGGDDASVPGDGPLPEGAEAGGGEGGGGDGGIGASLTKACADNASTYCAQLEQCAAFLFQTQYGDNLTCVARNTLACTDGVQAPGAGWTGDGLEACVKARSALDCNTFLHGKPAPNACRVTGAITTSSKCRYDAQCGSGYCRYASGGLCGNCVNLGATGAPCTTSSDCDGNLMCAGTCQVPNGVGGGCGATQPCQQGLVCAKGACAQPGVLGATCDPTLGGADCDYYQGFYCDGTSKTCKAYATPHDGQSCGGGAAVCFGGDTCFGGSCVAPVQDGSPCNTDAGENCLAPSSCQTGLCQLYSATQCK